MTMWLTRFLHDESGQDLIEYALLGSFVSLAAYAGASALGGALNGWYSALGTEMNEASDDIGTMIP